MDNKLANRIISELEKIRALVSRIRQPRHVGAPRQENEAGVGPEDAPKDEGDGAVGESALIPPANIPPAPCNTNEPKKSWYKTFKGWKPKLDAAKLILEIVAIPFAIVYAFVTYLMWRDVRDNFRVSERSWVGVRNATSAPAFHVDAPNLIVGRKYTLGFVVSNFGKTPARNLRGTTDTVILAKGDPFPELPRYRETADILKSVSPLPPGASIALMAQPSDQAITAADIGDFAGDPSRILYLYGSYTYEDIFGKSHFLKVCMFAMPDLTSMAACNSYSDAN